MWQTGTDQQLIGRGMCVMCVQGIPYGRIMVTLERGFPLDRVCQARQLNEYLQLSLIVLTLSGLMV